jgi:hypothetical protein
MTQKTLLNISQQRTVPIRRTCRIGLERVLSPTCLVLDAVCLNAVISEIAAVVVALGIAQEASNEVATLSLLVLMPVASVESGDALLPSRVTVKCETSATGSVRVPCRPSLVLHHHRETAADRVHTMDPGSKNSHQQQVGVKAALEHLLKVLKMDRAHHVASSRTGRNTTDSQPLLRWITNGGQKCAPTL